MWQGLKPSNPLTLLTVDYSMEILMGEDADGMCDGKIIKIPRREFIFRTCEDGEVWPLIPRRISPCSESFLGHIGTGILCGG